MELNDGTAPIPSGASSRRLARGKYTAKACESCRQRRCKCDGKWPSCSRCLNRSIECRYPSQDGRQPAPKSYVQLLRSRIELLEKVLDMHGIDVNQSITQLNAARGDSFLASSDLDDLRSSFEGALCLDESTNFDRDGEARYFGPTSGRLEFHTGECTAISTGEESETSSPTSTDHVTLPEQRLRLNRFLEELEAESEISEELETHLIDLYFTWEQPWVTVVEESAFKESRKSRGRHFSPLLLNCILAAGSRHSNRPEVRSNPNDPNTAGRIFLEKAEVLLYYDLKWPSITTIQSLTIISTMHCAIGADVACWTYQGLASRLALDMGLNIDPLVLSSPESLSSEDIQARRRIYWALYCNDKLSASYTGRVCTMLYSQGSVNLPEIPNDNTPIGNFTDVTFSPRFQTRDVTVLQRALVSHSRILEKIMLNLYGPRPATVGLKSITFAQSCILELRTWFYDLAPELRIDRSDTNRLPQAYTLHMVYHTGFILLMKPFLNLSQRADGTPTSFSINEATEDKGMMAKAVEICYEAAAQICLTSRKYRQAFGSFRNSPITATHCTLSAALIFLRLPTPEHARISYYHGIETCLKNLEELSTSWVPAGRYLRNLKHILRTSNPTKKDGSSLLTQPESTGDVTPSALISDVAQGIYNVSSVPVRLNLTDQTEFHTELGESNDGFALCQGDLSSSFWKNIENDFMFDDLPEDYFNFNTPIGYFRDGAGNYQSSRYMPASDK